MCAIPECIYEIVRMEHTVLSLWEWVPKSSFEKPNGGSGLGSLCGGTYHLSVIY